MTNELEKTFFDTFGIEPKCQNTFINPSKCPFNESRECCDCVSFEYPQITDSILLGLICIDNQENIYECRPFANNVEELKTYILEEFIRLHELGLFKRVNQVRTLFEEG